MKQFTPIAVTENRVNKPGNERHGDIYFLITFKEVGGPDKVAVHNKAITIDRTSKSPNGVMIQSQESIDGMRGAIANPKLISDIYVEDCHVEDLAPFNLKERGKDTLIVDKTTGMPKVFTSLNFPSEVVPDSTNPGKMKFVVAPAVTAEQIISRRGVLVTQ